MRINVHEMSSLDLDMISDGIYFKIINFLKRKQNRKVFPANIYLINELNLQKKIFYFDLEFTPLSDKCYR